MPIFRTGDEYQTRAERELEGVSGTADRLGSMGSGFLSDYQNTYLPAAQQAIGLASESAVNADVDRAAIDTGREYDLNRGIMERNLSRMGVSAGSGRFAGLQQQWALARAAARAGAMTRARREGNDSRIRNLLSAAQLGGQLPGLAIRATESSGGMRRGVYGDYDRLATERGEEESLNGYSPENAMADHNKLIARLHTNRPNVPRRAYKPSETYRFAGRSHTVPGRFLGPGQTAGAPVSGGRISSASSRQSGGIAEGNRAIKKSMADYGS